MELKLAQIEAPIVRLSPVEPESLAAAIAWAETPNFAEFFRRFPPLQDWMSWDRAAQVLASCYQVSVDGRLVGLATIHKHDSENVELGLLLEGDARVYSEQVRDQMISYAFNYLKVNRVFVRILPSRTGMISKHIGIGFKEEGRTRQSCQVNGKYSDELVFGLLKGERK